MASASEHVGPAPSATSFFEQVDQYAWDADAEFQSGLSSILSSATAPEQREELSLRARCFYFSRKYGTNVDFDQYSAYRASQGNADQEGDLAAVINSKHVVSASASNEPEPGPKLSYQEIVDLIQNGKPVPGIKEIPDTLLAGQGTSASQSRRRKPWEKHVSAVETPAGTQEAVETSA